MQIGLNLAVLFLLNMHTIDIQRFVFIVLIWVL